MLERRALRIMQNQNVPLYLFTLAAEEIDRVADIARISRNEAGKLIGYQRREKKEHVRHIQEYLDSADVLFPNALIMALPADVKFKSSRGPTTSDELGTTAGILEVPIAQGPNDPRPGWIVDGQQRSVALARAANTGFPVPVAGFASSDLALQRDQFMRVNSVQPLPTNLVTELLPEVVAAPSPRLSARVLPSGLVDMLNQDPASPFHNLIKRASTEPEEARQRPVTDNSLVEGLRESLISSSGALYLYRNIAAGTTDTEGIRRLLITYWVGVRNTFPDAWGRQPTESRLMHGVGIRAMSRLLDHVMVHVDLRGKDPVATVERELAHIAPLCRWTDGVWEELGLPWNGLQNTTKDISKLANYLMRAYMDSRR